VELAVVIGIPAVAVAVIEVIEARLRRRVHAAQAQGLGHALRWGQGPPAGGVRQRPRQPRQGDLGGGAAVSVEAAVGVLQPLQRPGGQVQGQGFADPLQRPRVAVPGIRGAGRQEEQEGQEQG